MATAQQGPDRIISTDSTESLDILTLNAEENPADAENYKEQPLSTEDEKMVSPNISHDATNIAPSRDTIGQQGSLATGGDRSVIYPQNVYSPQTQTQTIYYGGGYDNSGEWEEYPQYVHAEGVEIGSPGIYNENPSLVFHTGFGYSPQMPYGPYSPVTTPLPSMRSDGPLYSPQHFPHMGPYYQQPVPPGMPYITSPVPVSQAELSIPSGIDQQGAFLTDNTNSNGVLFGPRPGYPLQYGSSGRGNFAGSSGNLRAYDLHQGFDGFGSAGPWSDWSKSSDGQRSVTPLSSPAASPQPVGMVGSFGHTASTLAAGMASPQQRPLYGYGSPAGSYSRGYTHGGIYAQDMNFGGSIVSFGRNGRSRIAIDKGRWRGRVSGSLCSCNGTLDVLGEQNKGPRASRPKNQTSERNSSLDTKCSASTPEPDSQLYNRPDFVTEYKDAKFFIIKSYSEDNVHKSIKYGVWASTPSGNRKLDAAFRESREKEGSHPVYLLFSVNASAQFCGVAEMMGPVDFDKSVDYWQQDKWSGQFPVKWHIIKDVPNSQFRHIILENNDNKPVTNSRDTQEELPSDQPGSWNIVPRPVFMQGAFERENQCLVHQIDDLLFKACILVGLEQGLEMLSIFKNYETDMSILDDFDFYEDRQKAMQERKARQQASLMAAPAPTSIERRNPVAISGDLIKQMSKSFVQVVRLEDRGKESSKPEKIGSTAATAPAGANHEEPTKTTVALTSHGG